MPQRKRRGVEGTAPTRISGGWRSRCACVGSLLMCGWATVSEGCGDAHGGGAGATGISPATADRPSLESVATLRAALHQAIRSHTSYPYTAASVDTWDIVEAADQDPDDPNRILDVYRNVSFEKAGGGNDSYQREHLWPKSYGFPFYNRSNLPYTDCHHLRLSDGRYNSARGNNPFRDCDATCQVYPTERNGGLGGENEGYPSDSNWGTGRGADGTWEVWRGRRGDIARTMFYMDVRYEGAADAGVETAEPDLVLTDDAALIAATRGNAAVAYMGLLSVLLRWHEQDPVDDAERRRNDIVQAFQGNRNPFVDHPEWVSCVYGGECDETGLQGTP